ncbi:hypothetical protein PYCC9005_000755 [Savitreella phatthalungensis]
MLVRDSYVDLPTSSNVMRVFVFSPTIPHTPDAKFPGVVVFSEIYQVTKPVERLCRLIAGRGYVVACPSSYHEFEGTRAMTYSPEDTELGNKYKVEKKLTAFDEDSDLTVAYLQSHAHCTGKIGATGICLGGHLAFRAAFNPSVSATVTFFGTDIHSCTLSSTRTDSLDRASRGDITGEMCLIFGKEDNHVPRDGRSLIRQTLDDAGVRFTWLELAWAAHAFVRDEDSKGRYDPHITATCFDLMMELFNRRLNF